MDKDKIKQALECCVRHDPDDKARCGECPYGDPGINCVNRLKFHTLELVHEMEAQIDGLMELLKQKTILFEDMEKRLKEYESGKAKPDSRARKVLDGLAHCLPESNADAMMRCETCPYDNDCHRHNAAVKLPIEMVEDIRRFAKELLGKTLLM